VATWSPGWEADRERFFAALASQEPEELVERAERWARAMR
jgi:hypothetical protein